MLRYFILTTFLVTAAGFVTVAGQAAMAQEKAGRHVPTLIVTNEPMSEVAPDYKPAEPTSPASPVVAARVPQDIDESLYTKPTRTQDIEPARVLNDNYFAPVDTMTSEKIEKIRSEMYDLQGDIADAASRLQTLETVGQGLAADYYAAVATINTQLQSGTTPGNPRLKNRLTLAEGALDTLSGNVADLNKMAVQMADLASVANFLQQEARAAYGLSGSVEEDHVHLAQLEDSLANTAVAIDRLLNNVNDNITRAAAYMASERANLRTLSLAVADGNLYGKSLSNRPFSSAGSSDVMNEEVSSAPVAAAQSEQSMQMAQIAPAPTGPRPLIKIRFDRADVDYAQALYMSVNEAMQKYPNSQFELVAVSPGMGNPAKLAIESTKARRNAETVLRDMVQMGVDTNKVKLANLTQDDIQYNEVHLYIR